MCSRTGNTEDFYIVAAETDFAEIVVDAELHKGITRRSDRPVVGRLMLYQEITCLCKLFELAVVVGVPPAAIPHAVQIVAVVNHLMQQRRHNVFNRP